jgi:tRNA-splicing ligase RtcB
MVNNQQSWVHRKGATRAFPAGHHALKDTMYAHTGHPILLPGNPRDGSVVMVAKAGAAKSCYSVNHGAGRALGRKHANRTLDQRTVDQDFIDYDILTNFKEVLRSVEQAGLASTVATLKARFVIKDGSEADD